MNINLDAIKGAAKLVPYKFREARPGIALVAGVLSIAAGTILACIKTKEAEEVVEDFSIDLSTQRQAEDTANDGYDIPERAKLYGRYVIKFAKIYGIPAVVWLTGLFCILGSYGEMRHRNARLLADSVALKTLFDEYRNRVKEAVGEEVEKKLYFGAKPKDEEIEVYETDKESGETKLVKKNSSIFYKQPGSMYARNFTPRTSDEYDVRSYADYFLECRIANLNKKLRIVPFITLNEVYDELGFKPGEGRCAEGMTVGWVWNPKIDRGDREIIVEYLDGYERVYDSKLGKEVYEPCLRLDFNCYPLEGLV